MNLWKKDLQINFNKKYTKRALSGFWLWCRPCKHIKRKNN